MMFEMLIDTITKSHTKNSLLYENHETINKRKILELQRTKIIDAKKILKI